MTFTKKHSDQNKAMTKRANELVAESGFFNPPPPMKNQWEFGRYRQPYLDRITNQIAGEFPDVPRRRVSSRVSRALMKAHGDYVRRNKSN